MAGRTERSARSLRIVLSGGQAPGAGEYEERFVQILSRISAQIRVRGSARRFNSLVLYDDRSSDVQTIHEHYSIRLSLREHLPEALAGAIETCTGLKLAFIQDEYEYPEIARRWLDRLRFDIVYT